MQDVFTADAAAELAVITRGGLVESRHYGAAVVVDPAGNPIFELGDTTTPVYPRSSLKPFQAIASLRTGVLLNSQQTALACASHTGATIHQQVALSMLSAAGLSEADLQCPTAWPADKTTRREWTLSQRQPNQLAFNCSGKHAGFLAACVHAGLDTNTYLEHEHPLQQSVLEVLTEYAGVAPEHVSTDGCGAPAPTLPLLPLAKAVSQLATGSEPAAQQVFSAMLAHPELVQGPDAENTVVSQRLGILAKLGAEGVLILVTKDGHAAAIKSLDGAHRPTTLVGLRLLAAAGALERTSVDAVLADILPKITGGVEAIIVGQVELGRDVLTALS
ncbi:asparaginase [Micrococcoides hystricis]|uniref:Asparaginase n=1 Tax=Micrococcoides hystricis TaxID=1572761 RepID=A0ABV6PF75_9MICC